MSRNPPLGTEFSTLLKQHMENGTRPGPNDGEPWTNEGFADEVGQASGGTCAATTVGNWKSGRSLPNEINPILRVLFGPGNVRLDAREALREAYKRGRAKKFSSIVSETATDPAGRTWKDDGSQFVLDRNVTPQDEAACLDPTIRQMHEFIVEASSKLVGSTQGLDNQHLWKGIHSDADRFHNLVKDGIGIFVRRLGTAYAVFLRLSRYIETDRMIRSNPNPYDLPLDPKIYGELVDLVRTAAPWLRGFPTVARLDDEAGRALSRAGSAYDAQRFVETARNQNVISQDDADEVGILADSASSASPQSEKAHASTLAYAKNLLLAEALTIAASLMNPSLRSASAQRAIGALLASKAPTESLASSMSPDFQEALKALLREGSQEEQNVIHTAVPNLALKSWRESAFAPELIIIPAGSFVMGAGAFDKAANKDELPGVEINIKSFALGKFAVTNEQFLVFANEIGLHRSAYVNPDKSALRHPAAGISWTTASQYCEWLSRKLSLKEDTYRLPSEAEWEYAARAGTVTEFIWGSEPHSAYSHFGKNNTIRGTIPVDEKIPNKWGLHQMFGNVWEWCADDYSGDLKSVPTDGSSYRADGKASARVIRGSSWFSNSGTTLRAAHRGKPYQSIQESSIGFRVARSLPTD